MEQIIIDDDSDDIINDIAPAGTDLEDPRLTEVAPTYPVSEEDRIGVSTDEGENPTSMDQGDEQNDAVIWGTPDDTGEKGAYPPPIDEDEVKGHVIS